MVNVSMTISYSAMIKMEDDLAKELADKKALKEKEKLEKENIKKSKKPKKSMH